MTNPDSAGLKNKKPDQANNKNIRNRFYNQLTNTLREIKTPEELTLLRKAVFISSIAHAEAMKAIRPNISERELEGILTFVHKKYGLKKKVTAQL